MPAAPRLPWTRAESQALAAAGILVEPPEAAILREAESWRNPLRFARDRLILVAPRRVGGETVPPHPFWHELRPMLKEMKALDQVVVPAARLAAGEHLDLAGRTIARVAVTCVDLPEPRRLWLTPAGTIARRGTESVSSIKRLIECPFAWTLQYAARIRPGQVNALPNDDQVIGTLAHAIIERLLTDGRARTPDEGVAEAVRILVRLMTEAGLRVRACEDAKTEGGGTGCAVVGLACPGLPSCRHVVHGAIVRLSVRHLPEWARLDTPAWVGVRRTILPQFSVEWEGVLRSGHVVIV
ncbi:MAG: PD-(D/E)XK nuclease family protein, partial [Alphaproteobacteria bacterium]